MSRGAVCSQQPPVQLEAGREMQQGWSEKGWSGAGQ